jgi:glycosyltransferase involved in cell wall biosynthesis
MQIVYTHSAKFAGPGMGSIAYQLVRQLYQRGDLQRAVVGYADQHDLPRSHIVEFPWMRLVARLARDRGWLRDFIFDRAAAAHLVECDIFHGWSHQCLHSLRKARARYGATIFLERQNSHELHQHRLLLEEYERWGYREHAGIRSRVIQHALTEYEEADYITVPSQFVYDSMVAEGISTQRLCLTPYGVDVERFSPSEEEPEVFRVLFVGQVCLRKGVPYLLQAWQQLQLPDAELWLVGRITPDAQKVVSSYMADPSIHFLGHVPDTAALYRKASVFAFPTIEEGSALVTYEAMASGLPLVYTYNSGAVARDGVEGIQVPIRDPQSIAAAIERLYAEPDLRRKMGCAARKRSEAYTWDHAAQRLLDTYRAALKTAKAASRKESDSAS